MPLNNHTNNNTHHDQNQCEQLSQKDLRLANVNEDHINTILVLKYDMLHEVIKQWVERWNINKQAMWY